MKADSKRVGRRSRVLSSQVHGVSHIDPRLCKPYPTPLWAFSCQSKRKLWILWLLTLETGKEREREKRKWIGCICFTEVHPCTLIIMQVVFKVTTFRNSERSTVYYISLHYTAVHAIHYSNQPYCLPRYFQCFCINMGNSFMLRRNSVIFLCAGFMSLAKLFVLYYYV
jgi:hypothetical protein